MIKNLLRAILTLLAACSGHELRQGPRETVRVQAQPAKSSAGDSATWVAGTLLAAQRAVVSTRLAAKVRAVRVDEGAPVKRGELLIRLDDDEVLAQVRGAETALSAAKMHERRISTLASKGAATPSDLEAAQSQRALAEAQSASAHATVGYTEIRAPFDGIVQAKRVQPGDLVSPGQPLLELVGGGLEIAASVSEEESQGIHKGEHLQFEVADHRGEAEVVALAPGGEVTSHRGLVRARLLGPADLRAGSFARLRLPARRTSSQSVWVPSSAVVQRGDLTGVFVAQNGLAELRWLSLGNAEGGLIAVRAGLRAGELVINPPGVLRDGQPVEVASAP
jgi:RND family efflux transporter MFP subunit